MTADRDRQVKFTVDELTCALLELAATARWPDGLLLLELDSAVLREQLAPRLFTALVAAGSDTCTPPTGRGPGAQPQPTDPSVPQEHTC